MKPAKYPYGSASGIVGFKKFFYFIGRLPRNSVFEELKEHHAFLMPSYNETFGLVFLEAMANGCIVLGAEGWGIDGIIVNNQNGFLCNPYNQSSISESIKKILTFSGSQLDQLRTNSMKTVLNFSEEKVASDYLAFLQAIKKGNL